MINPTDMTVLAAVVAVTMIAPLLILRQDRARWAIAEAAFWIAATLGYAAIRLFELDVPGTVLFSVVFVARATMFVVLVSSSEDTTFRWSPVHAGVASTIVYLLLIPHVLQWPIDGDEPFFLLVTESIVHDLDLDLANQYSSPELSETGRTNLKPQAGDPVGEHGEIFSRHEPFLPVLLVPGYLLGGLHGAVITIALLGGLLATSLLKLVEEDGHLLASRSMVWPALALAPPVLFYATRMWAEVPGALAFSEAIRAMRARRWGRFVVWLLALSLLQLRFGVVAAGLLVVAIVTHRPPLKRVATGLLVLIVPFVALWIGTGRLFGVHRMFELLPMNPVNYLRGTAGLIVDAQAGLLFQAPFWLLAILVIVRRDDRAGTGMLWLAVVPYLVLLVPRSEWHGGWSPPLRYLVVLAPVIALSLARVMDWLAPQVKFVAAAWTVGVVTHGIAYPWRLFHIASGESVLGESLSRRFEMDFSRLLPSLIRINAAALVWIGLVVVVALVLVRFRGRISSAAVAIVLCTALAVVSVLAREPGRVVQLEDTHVEHRGGELYPERWTVARFRFRGGWSMPEGAAARFRIEPGDAKLDYRSDQGAVIDLNGRRWTLAPTEGFGSAVISIESEEVELSIVEGSLVIDRVTRE